MLGIDDAVSLFGAVAGVNGEPFEREKNLDLIRGELYADFFTAVNMRDGVVSGVDAHGAIGMDLRGFPFNLLKRCFGQRF